LWERDYRGTSWFKDYLTLHPASYYDDPRRRDERAVHRREFEAKIRMPLHLFQSLLAKMEADPAMQADLRKAVPLNVQLAASLRFLAIGCWDAMEDIFQISKRTLRHWFHDKFLPWMMKNEYDANVWYPTTPEEIAEATEVFTRAGFPGCIASIDGVHFAYEGYASQDRHFFVGKERYPCVGVNVAVDYHGRAMHVSRLHRGGDPDVTMAAEDAFLESLDVDDVFRDFEFFLTSPDGRVGVKGVYTIGDNGYPKWRTIVHPFKHPVPGSDTEKWSKDLESLRKNVECFFGRLKRQFMVLANRIGCRDTAEVEKMIKVCICLSNMVHDSRAGMWDDLFAEWLTVDTKELEDIRRPRASQAKVAAAIERAKKGDTLDDVPLDCILLAAENVNMGLLRPGHEGGWTRRWAIAELRRLVNTTESLLAAERDAESEQEEHEQEEPRTRPDVEPLPEVPTVPGSLLELQRALIVHYKHHAQVIKGRSEVQVMPPDA